MNTVPQIADYLRILPEIVLSIFGMVIMVLDPLLEERSRAKILGAVGLVGALVALVSTFCMAKQPGPGFLEHGQVDAFSVFFHFLITAITAVVILTSYEYMEVQKIRAGEYYGADPVRRGWHVSDVVRGRAGADFHRAGNFFDLHLHPGRFPQTCRHQQRIFGQILFAGIVCHCILSLRRGADVRRHRIDQHSEISKALSREPFRCWPTPRLR